MGKTKKPTGLTISRNKNQYVTEWKIGESKGYNDGQDYEYLWDYTKHSEKKDWPNKKVKNGTTKVTLTLDPKTVYPKKGKLKVNDLTFRVRGKRKKESTSDYTTSKPFSLLSPLKPSVSVTKESAEFTCTFSWQAVGSDSDHRPCTDTHWESIILQNSDSDVKKVAGKFKPNQNAFIRSGSDNADNWSAPLSGSRSFNETGLRLANNVSYTRWFRVCTRGPHGDSEYAYAYHTYANAVQASVDGGSVSVKRLASGGFEVYLKWTGDRSFNRPSSQSMVQYLVTVPAENGDCPEGSQGWVDTIEQIDTKGADAKRFTIPSSVIIGDDQALFLRVNTMWDNKTTEGVPYRVTSIKSVDGKSSTIIPVLSKPIFGNPSVELDPATFRVRVYAQHQCQIPGSFIAVYYKTTKHQTATLVGVIAADETDTVIQLSDWTEEGSKQFGIKSVVGEWRQEDTFQRAVTKEYLASQMRWDSGSVPEAPQNVNVSMPNGLDGTVRVTWDWTWSDSNAVEISWADHPDAWESTSGPSTYIIDSLKSNHWNISGLTIGQKWYVRVRLIKITGENSVYGDYSPIEDGTINLISAPDKPKLVLTPETITKTGKSIATWAYSSEDGTTQQGAIIQECTVDDDGTITEGETIATITDSSQRYVIDPIKIGESVSGWNTESAAENHTLRIKVTSENGESNDGWSDPVTLKIAEKPTVSISDLGDTLVWRDEEINPADYSGAYVEFGEPDLQPVVKRVEMDIDPIAGSGKQSPDNIRTITGYDSIILYKSNGSPTSSALTDTTDLPDDLTPVYAGHLNMTTGALTVTHMVLEFDGTETWDKIGNYLVTVVDDSTFKINDELFGDRYVFDQEQTEEYGFSFDNVTPNYANYVDYGVVGTMTVER